MIDETFIQEIEELTARKPSVTVIHSDEQTVKKLVVGPDVCEIVEEKKLIKDRSHQFKAFDSFSEFLTKYGAEKTPVVFIEDNLVVADLDYQSNRNDLAFLSLEYSEEYEAFAKLFHGVSQKQLWRLLISDLDGFVQDNLLFEISQLKLSSKSESDIRIDDTGLGGSNSANFVQLDIPAKDGGSNLQNLHLDWEFKGRFYECMDRVYEVPFRLELAHKDGKLVFTAHPKGVNRILTQARRDLIEALKAKIKNADIYDGIMS